MQDSCSVGTLQELAGSLKVVVQTKRRNNYGQLFKNQAGLAAASATCLLAAD
jgi:hypothetical protein